MVIHNLLTGKHGIFVQDSEKFITLLTALGFSNSAITNIINVANNLIVRKVFFWVHEFVEQPERMKCHWRVTRFKNHVFRRNYSCESIASELKSNTLNFICCTSICKSTQFLHSELFWRIVLALHVSMVTVSLATFIPQHPLNLFIYFWILHFVQNVGDTIEQRQETASVSAESDRMHILARVFTAGSAVPDKWRHHTDLSATIAATIFAVFRVRRPWKILHLLHFRETISFFSLCRRDSKVTHSSALLYAMGMVMLNAIGVFAINQLFITGYHNGMKVRVAVCSIIYRKVRLSNMPPIPINF